MLEPGYRLNILGQYYSLLYYFTESEKWVEMGKRGQPLSKQAGFGIETDRNSCSTATCRASHSHHHNTHL
jgi:hypothetical protein